MIPAQRTSVFGFHFTSGQAIALAGAAAFAE